MSFVGNFLWFIFGGGFFLGLSWLFAGVLCCCTIIGIPFGIACFRVASFSFFPFGKDLIPAKYLGQQAVVGSGLMNVIWVIFFGFSLAFFHIIVGICECCTIIGIPFGLANFKIAKAAFAPLGKRIVPKAVAAAAYQQYAAAQLNNAFAKNAPQAAAPQIAPQAAPQIAPQAAAPQIAPQAAPPSNPQQ